MPFGQLFFDWDIEISSSSISEPLEIFLLLVPTEEVDSKADKGIGGDAFLSSRLRNCQRCQYKLAYSIHGYNAFYCF